MGDLNGNGGSRYEYILHDKKMWGSGDGDSQGNGQDPTTLHEIGVYFPDGNGYGASLSTYGDGSVD